LTKSSSRAIVTVKGIESHILQVRGQRVMLDADLAALYGVETRALLQAIKRNRSRFPEDFMFQLNQREFAILRSQTVISSSAAGHGGRRYPPYAFTEQGVAMLSSVLRSPRAIQANIGIMRAFVRLRQMLAAHADLARKLVALEKRYDHKFKIVFDAIRELMEPAAESPEPPAEQSRQIGFRASQPHKPKALRAKAGG
jgi:hypothetical protein